MSNEVNLYDLEENKYYKLKKPIHLEDPQQAWIDYQIVQEELNLLAKDFHKLIDIDDTTLTFEFLLTDELVSVEQLVNPNEVVSANLPKVIREFITINLEGLPDGENTIFLKRMGTNKRANKAVSANQEGGARKKSVKRRKSVNRKSSAKRKSK